MDDAKLPADGNGLDGSGDGFVPLKLVLRPSGLVTELTRPDMVVGRHSDADIRLPLPDVSRRHCRFVFAAGVWQVFDLGSLNGVTVNGNKVEQAVLHESDVVGIGGFRFNVCLGTASAEEGHPSDSAQTLGLLPGTIASLPSDSDHQVPKRKAS